MEKLSPEDKKIEENRKNFFRELQDSFDNQGCLVALKVNNVQERKAVLVYQKKTESGEIKYTTKVFTNFQDTSKFLLGFRGDDREVRVSVDDPDGDSIYSLTINTRTWVGTFGAVDR
jgi:hypothetical protein